MVIAILATLTAALFTGQDATVLHIKVTLLDAAKTPVPIARAALLISDDPPTAAPRRVVTTADGTATVRLRPGNYFVESDEPVAFGGKGYEWRTTVKVSPGKDATLELTAANAVIGAAPAPSAASPSTASSAPGASRDDDVRGASLPPQAQDSVVAIWTAESRGSGFLFNTAGLVATNQRVVGSARTVDVQLAPSLKVAARVLVTDASRDVAILWIDAAAAAAMHPVTLPCGAATSPMKEGQKVIALGAPLRGEKDAEPGEVFHVEARVVVADFRLSEGSLGGPIFGGNGVFVGLSSVDEDKDARRGKNARVISADDVCAAAGVAEKAMSSTEAPSAAHLPVEPSKQIDERVLDDVVKRRQGNLNPYQFSSASFDVTILTPVVIRGARQ